MTTVNNALLYFTISSGGSGYELFKDVSVYANGTLYGYASCTSGIVTGVSIDNPGAGLLDGTYSINGSNPAGTVTVYNGKVVSGNITYSGTFTGPQLITANIPFDFNRWPSNDVGVHVTPSLSAITRGPISSSYTIWNSTPAGLPSAFVGTPTVTMGGSSGAGAVLVPVMGTYDTVSPPPPAEVPPTPPAEPPAQVISAVITGNLESSYENTNISGTITVSNNLEGSGAGGGAVYENPKIVRVTTDLPFPDDVKFSVDGSNVVNYTGNITGIFDVHVQYKLASNAKGDATSIEMLPKDYMALYAYLPPESNTKTYNIYFWAWTYDSDTNHGNNPAIPGGHSLYEAVPSNLNSISASQTTMVLKKEISVFYDWTTATTKFKEALKQGSLYKLSESKGLV